jgi:hypothetical protein
MRKLRSKVQAPEMTGAAPSLWRKLAGSSRPKQDKQQNLKSDTNSAQSSTSTLGIPLDSNDSSDLCQKAEESLSDDHKTKHLWQTYLEILKEDLPRSNLSTAGSRTKQLSELLDAKAKELEAKRMKFELREYELKI